MPGIYVIDNFSLSVLSVEDDTPRFYGVTVQTWGFRSDETTQMGRQPQ